MSSYLAQYLDQTLITQKRAAGTERPVMEGALAVPGEVLTSLALGPLAMPSSFMEPASALGGAMRGAKKRADKSLAWNLIPGVAAYERGQRQRQTLNASNDRGGHGTANVLSEYLGGLTSMLPLGLAGSLVGNHLYMNQFDPQSKIRATADGTLQGPDINARRLAILGGAGIGVSLPVLAAMMLAAVTKKRSKDEQLKHDASGSRAVLNYLVPGLSTYNALKRQGAATNYGNEGIR